MEGHCNNKYFSCLTYFLIVSIFVIFSSCKKEKSNFRNSSLLQHRWNLKNTSIRGNAGPWSTTPATPGKYREFKSDGTCILASSGIVHTGTYEFISNDMLIIRDYTNINPPYLPPADTSFIRHLDDTLYVSYYRNYLIVQPPFISSLSEVIDTLIR